MDLLEHAPRFDPAAAASLATELYGIIVTALPLPSERDQNFLLSTRTDEQFVLKIANALESRALLEAQNEVMAHLETRLSFCPRVLPSISGENIVPVESIAGTVNFVRLVTYLPGVPLAAVKQPSPRLLRDLGRKLGQVDRELVSFEHVSLHRDFHWDLAHGTRVIEKYGRLITDTGLQALIYQCGEMFASVVEPLMTRLRRSVIHGDANDYNVLVDSGCPPSNVIGLIDFGDMVSSFTVGDLAIAVAYAVLDHADPLAVASQLLAGYNEAYPLNDHELEALYGLMLLRLCMSVCLAAHQQQQRPDNQYLEISQLPIKRNLQHLATIDYRHAVETFRSVCSR
jgi:Ser/Thr protein kinase RdoA (MazF antagonist)